jgi:hypothetical protein
MAAAPNKTFTSRQAGSNRRVGQFVTQQNTTSVLQNRKHNKTQQITKIKAVMSNVERHLPNICKQHNQGSTSPQTSGDFSSFLVEMTPLIAQQFTTKHNKLQQFPLPKGGGRRRMFTREGHETQQTQQFSESSFPVLRAGGPAICGDGRVAWFVTQQITTKH